MRIVRHTPQLEGIYRNADKHAESKRSWRSKKRKGFYPLLDPGKTNGIFCSYLGRKRICKSPPKRTKGCVLLATKDVLLTSSHLQSPDETHIECRLSEAPQILQPLCIKDPLTTFSFSAHRTPAFPLLTTEQSDYAKSSAFSHIMLPAAQCKTPVLGILWRRQPTDSQAPEMAISQLCKTVK